MISSGAIASSQHKCTLAQPVAPSYARTVEGFVLARNFYVTHLESPRKAALLQADSWPFDCTTCGCMASRLDQASRVGPYEIIENIGQGAMGDVYRARDSRLSRNVAIKVIAEAEVDDARRRRFVQEARAASALNHPNIVTIHDFGTENGLSYIVAELVEGESLRSLINRGAVPMRELLDIAVQIADALAAAHEAGIVHRDLKPENIMITRDGRVKLLDFGLAKPLAAGDPERTLDENATQPGLLLGTVAYMSPEQAHGMPATFQSDQFSFGVIMHEMATGRHPFRRETPMETLIAIGNFERPPFTPGPVTLRMLVERCLGKDPSQRFAATRQLAERLEKIRRDLPEAPAPEPEQPNWWKRVSPRAVSALLIGFAVLAVCVVAASRLLAPAIGNPLSFRFVPFATDAGVEVFPAWSPSGRAVAYSAEKDGVLQIYTRAPGALSQTRVTNSDSDCLFPFWAPDGSRLYYISAHNGGPALWSINAAGGSPELVRDNVAQAAITPNGRVMAMLRADNNAPESWSLWLSSPPAGKPKPYTVAPFDHERFLRWSFLQFSPDSKELGFWGSRFGGRSGFWLVPLDGGAPKRRFESLDSKPQARAFTWVAGTGRVLFSASDAVYGTSNLWLGDANDGTLRQITNGPDLQGFPAASPTGHKAAFSSLRVAYEFRSVPLMGERAAPVATVTAAIASSCAWAPDGSRYAYVTEREGMPEIHMRSADGAWERAIVSAKAFDRPTASFNDLAFSPNGQSIAYTRTGPDGEAIWVSTTSGEPPVRLTDSRPESFQRSATWAPDGNWIAYISARAGRYSLMKVRIGDKRPQLVANNVGTRPRWSPDGRQIATLGVNDRVVLTSSDGSATHVAGSHGWLNITWTRDSSALIGVKRTGARRLAVASLSQKTGEESIIEDLGPWPAAFTYAQSVGMAPVRGISIAPHGQTLILSMLNFKSDLWLLEGLTRPGLLDRWRTPRRE